MGIMSELDQSRKDVMASFAGDIFGPDEDDDQLPLFSAEGNKAEANAGLSDSEGYDGDDEASETDGDDDESLDDDPDQDADDDDGDPEAEQDDEPDKNDGAGKKDNDPAEKEAARKAEWERKQAKKKEDEAHRLDEIQNMDPSQIATASSGLITQGVERLTRRNMKIEVGEHIKRMCVENPEFARKVMHPRKSIMRCFQFISKKARDYLMEEKKQLGEDSDFGYGGGRMDTCGDVPDELCYAWAVEYYEASDLDIDKDKDEKYKPGYVPKKNASKSAAKSKKEAPKKEEAKAVLKPQKSSILDDMVPLG